MHLFLSPHYDDAVLSCGGLLHQLAARGVRTCVYTVMAAAPAVLPATPFVQELHERWGAGGDPVTARRAEDAAALALLGAEALYGPLPDCIYRTGPDGEPLYTTEAALFGPVHPDDPALHLPVVLPADGPLEALYAPLAVGRHVDHQIMRDWALALGRAHPQLALMFYEDYPYKREPHAVERALEYFGGALHPVTIPLEAAAVSAKIRAAACYVSQISTFWSGTEDMAEDIRRATVYISVPAERVWRFVVKDTA